MTKIEAFWENATSEDVAEIANTRKSIVARVRDEENEGWVDCPLVGWKLSKHLPGHRWIDADAAMWNHCQVYREPSYWTNKPDPGPEWRLLGKFPDEPVAVGDEFFRDYEWHPSCLEIGDPQTNGIWYRRRIEPVEAKPVLTGSMRDSFENEMLKRYGWKADQLRTQGDGRYFDLGIEQYWQAFQAGAKYQSGQVVEPEPQHYILRVGDSVETPRGHKINVVSLNAEQRIYSLDAGDKLTLPNGQAITITEKGFEVKE